MRIEPAPAILGHLAVPGRSHSLSGETPERQAQASVASSLRPGGVVRFVLTIDTTDQPKAVTHPTDSKLLCRGVLCDGVGSAFTSILGSPAVSTFAQNVGVISLTGVASRHVVALTGVFLALAAAGVQHPGHTEMLQSIAAEHQGASPHRLPGKANPAVRAIRSRRSSSR